MSDTISRQAAISAICSACGKIDCDKMDKCEKLQLPPVNNSENPNSSDAISRQQAIEIVENYFKKIGLNGDICVDGLRQLPPIQPKRGKWIDKGVYTYVDDHRHLYKCDQCGNGWLDTPDFCPNCGCRMDGGEQ